MANAQQTQDIDGKDRLVSADLTSENFKMIFAESADVVNRDILIRNRTELKVTLFYIDGMANQRIINDDIVNSLSVSKWFDDCITQGQAFNLSLNGAVETGSIRPTESMKQAVESLLSGDTILVF